MGCCEAPCGECSDEKVYSAHDYIGAVSAEQQARCEEARALFRMVEDFLLRSPAYGSRTYSDRCLAVAKTQLEHACHHTIKSIVFEGKQVR